MSEIAEIRKLFQDLIAPDLKSVATELAALRTSSEHQLKAQRELIDLQIKSLTEKMQSRFDSADALEQARFATVIGKIEALRNDFAAMEAIQSNRHEAILKALDIDKRLERVETRQAASSHVA